VGLAKGMRQEDLEQHGINYRYYGRIERGLVNLTLDTLLKLCDIFDVTPTELFSFLEGEKVSEDREAVAGQITKLFRQKGDRKVKKLRLFLEQIL
jgi:transcriptional regulator with XRE-family HTH domain